MLLRICLILAILAGLAVIGLSHFKLKPQMEKTIEEREFNRGKWQEFEGKFKRSQNELKVTTETLQKTQTELDDTKTALVGAQNKAEEQQKRADALKMSLDETRGQLNSAQQQLAAWAALGVPVEQISAMIQSERQLRTANEALEAEKLVLIKVNQKMKDEMDRIKTPNRHPPMRADLRGQIVAVDPKWDFVVLNVGEDDDVKQNGVFMVSRDSKFIGKLVVTTVQPQRSIANVMPGWQIDEIQEGDIVIPE